MVPRETIVWLDAHQNQLEQNVAVLAEMATAVERVYRINREALDKVARAPERARGAEALFPYQPVVIDEPDTFFEFNEE